MERERYTWEHYITTEVWNLCDAFDCFNMTRLDCRLCGKHSCERHTDLEYHKCKYLNTEKPKEPEENITQQLQRSWNTRVEYKPK